ncbi:dephospho-CoA kinase [Arcanobacterium ihumii]|uniref:dephospho-CoA kinase n=1 Tax=Arcanobacterium ihumii TaxID=2138162 RepID=UPI00135AB9B9|nr:dephospho-CoA kinase [Arcanobacterium ihumii]
MLVLALTGGIAAGKSYFAKALAHFGAQIIDYDVLARKAVELGSPALEKIAATWGREVLLPNGTLDRAKLAQIVFSSSDDLELLNSITHPRITELAYEAEQAAQKRNPSVVIVHDIPLLRGSDIEKRAQGIVVIAADENVRLERMIRERGMTTDDARLRMSQQLSNVELARHADVVVDNSNVEHSEQILECLWNRWVMPFEKNLSSRSRTHVSSAALMPVEIRMHPNLSTTLERLERRGFDCKQLADDMIEARNPSGSIQDIRERLARAGFVPSGESFESANPVTRLKLRLVHWEEE